MVLSPFALATSSPDAVPLAARDIGTRRIAPSTIAPTTIKAVNFLIFFTYAPCPQGMGTSEPISVKRLIKPRMKSDAKCPEK
jgi:hypothetical protein